MSNMLCIMSRLRFMSNIMWLRFMSTILYGLSVGLDACLRYYGLSVGLDSYKNTMDYK